MYKSPRENARDMCREIEELKEIIKTKEQECETWKKELDRTHLLMLERQDELVKEILKNDQLKAENEELKTEVDKFEEALDKIKKIAESCITPYGHIFTDEIEQIIELCKVTDKNNDVVPESLEDRLLKAFEDKEFWEFALKKFKEQQNGN